jgi:hypothetical protein
MAIAAGRDVLSSTTTVLRVPIATKDEELSKDAMVSSDTPVEGAVEAPEPDLVQEGAALDPKRELPGGRWKGGGPRS